MSQPKSIALELAAEIEGNPWHLAQKAAAELRRLAGVEAERDLWKHDYGQACKLVADMHMAATGQTIGPVLGVVEDVAALKAERDRQAARIRELEKLVADLLAEVGTEPAPLDGLEVTDSTRGEWVEAGGDSRKTPR